VPIGHRFIIVYPHPVPTFSKIGAMIIKTDVDKGSPLA